MWGNRGTMTRARQCREARLGHRKTLHPMSQCGKDGGQGGDVDSTQAVEKGSPATAVRQPQCLPEWAEQQALGSSELHKLGNTHAPQLLVAEKRPQGILRKTKAIVPSPSSRPKAYFGSKSFITSLHGHRR